MKQGGGMSIIVAFLNDSDLAKMRDFYERKVADAAVRDRAQNTDHGESLSYYQDRLREVAAEQLARAARKVAV